jgi:hypothetical protein
MAGVIPKNNKRKVLKLNAIAIDKSNTRHLSIQECGMKDIKRGDVFIILEGSLELVLGKDNKFIWRAKTDAIPHKDSFAVQAEEI